MSPKSKAKIEDMSNKSTEACLTAILLYECKVCKIFHTEKKDIHRQTKFHRDNLKLKSPMTIEEFKKKNKTISINQPFRGNLSITDQSPKKDKKKSEFNNKTEHKSAKKVEIKKLVAEHSHNNHHGLPGSGKYAHRGPESTPGKNHTFRTKKTN